MCVLAVFMFCWYILNLLFDAANVVLRFFAEFDHTRDVFCERDAIDPLHHVLVC